MILKYCDICESQMKESSSQILYPHNIHSHTPMLELDLCFQCKIYFEKRIYELYLEIRKEGTKYDTKEFGDMCGL